MFEAFEHTADVGLRIRAGTLEELFAEAGRGFFALAMDNPQEIRPEKTFTISLEAGRLEDLFFDWLSELLYSLDGRHMLLSRFDVRLSGLSLRAEVAGEPIDRDRHELAHEIKAITYHGLKVEQAPDGWLAEVILDI